MRAVRSPQAPRRERLARLRRLFLEGTGGGDYWESEEDLDAYDLTFGARIGWKWDWVLETLKAQGWRPPVCGLLDWGCGSGAASRAFLRAFGPGAVSGLSLSDHSPLAVRVAARNITAAFPAIPVDVTAKVPEQPGILLVSHVLTELSPAAREKLHSLALGANVVLWVEPGTQEAARLLGEVREALLPSFSMVAPCPVGNTPCPLRDPSLARHWCHQFAPPPAFAFTDSEWVRFGRETGIDLRSLPLSFLVAQRQFHPSLPEGTLRVLGRPRLEKAALRVLTCGVEGLHESRLSRREQPDLFRAARKGVFPPLLQGMP